MKHLVPVVAICLLAACNGQPKDQATTSRDITQTNSAQAPAATPARTAPLICDLKPTFLRADEGGTTRLQVLEGDPIAALGGARPLAYVSTLKVNTDGTRRSYHQDDPTARTKAINDIRNAMNRRHRSIAKFNQIRNAGWPSPLTWRYLNDQVIERDKTSGKPCIDADGYMVSMTSDVVVPGGFNRQGDCDQTKWIDALAIPGIVVPKGQNEFWTRHARKRSPAMAVAVDTPANRSFGIIGDAGPVDQLGEGNVAMNRQLSGLPATDIPANYQDAKDRFQAPRSLVVLFPGAGNTVSRPFDAAKAGAAARAAFDAWGGESRLTACLSALR